VEQNLGLFAQFGLVIFNKFQWGEAMAMQHLNAVAKLSHYEHL